MIFKYRVSDCLFPDFQKLNEEMQKDFLEANEETKSQIIFKMNKQYRKIREKDTASIVLDSISGINVYEYRFDNDQCSIIIHPAWIQIFETYNPLGFLKISREMLIAALKNQCRIILKNYFKKVEVIGVDENG
jgi:hypothetical protein